MAHRDHEDRRHVEAVAWLAALSRRHITHQDLEAFRQWRKDPDNRAVYDELSMEWKGDWRTLH